MADPRRRRPENAAGPWFVDDTCIDCGTCMWMAPEVFAQRGDMSAVIRQPPPRHEDASAALLSCPTGSIGGPAAKVAFPRPIAPGVSHCGYHDTRSFGATSYVVQTDIGKVLVDVPRFAKPIVTAMADGGGIDHLVFTHRDDVAGHEAWHEETGAPRSIHSLDDVIGAERPLEGAGGRVAGLEWLHVPGHTRGHVVYRHEDVVFTGDHLAAAAGRLTAFRNACWYDWDAQIDSMAKMADWEVRHVLPGHGDPWHGEPQEYQEQMTRLLDWMEAAR